MKTKNVQTLICLVLFFMLAGQAWAEVWVYYGSNDFGDMYYDKSRIAKVNKRTASVWTKNKLNPEGKTKYFAILKGIGKEPDSPSALEYYTEMLEIDHANKKIKNISVTFYDEKGNVIYSSPKSLTGEWSEIHVGSVGEKLLDRVISESVAPGKALVYVPPVTGKKLPQDRIDQHKTMDAAKETFRAGVIKKGQAACLQAMRLRIKRTNWLWQAVPPLPPRRLRGMDISLLMTIRRFWIRRRT